MAPSKYISLSQVLSGLSTRAIQLEKQKNVTSPQNVKTVLQYLEAIDSLVGQARFSLMGVMEKMSRKVEGRAEIEELAECSGEIYTMLKNERKALLTAMRHANVTCKVVARQQGLMKRIAQKEVQGNVAALKKLRDERARLEREAQKKEEELKEAQKEAA
jgi:hypothetical protein